MKKTCREIYTLLAKKVIEQRRMTALEKVIFDKLTPYFLKKEAKNARLDK